eukprot:4481927-Heterocapsa_arctica.AAC.2
MYTYKEESAEAAEMDRALKTNVTNEEERVVKSWLEGGPDQDREGNPRGRHDPIGQRRAHLEPGAGAE